jgi:hypothetical protein
MQTLKPGFSFDRFKGWNQALSSYASTAFDLYRPAAADDAADLRDGDAEVRGGHRRDLGRGGAVQVERS